MLTELAIPKKPARPTAADYAQLYSLGLQRVRDLSSRIWTDYNTHDPGITSLEMLCYAITDLSYRAQMPVQDLLATATDNEANMRGQFYTARQILPSRPLTRNDYRKLLIDLPGVQNAWVLDAEQIYYVDKVEAKLLAEDNGSPVVDPVSLMGLYRVLIDYVPGQTQEQKDAVLDSVHDLLHANRNLCEDFVDYAEVETQPFLICGEIELRSDADTAEVYAQILFQVEQYLAPPVNNYTLDEMLEKAANVDEIFEGPLLRCGFIPDDELQAADLRADIRLSDIINIIVDIPGVIAVRDLIINPVGTTIALANKWRVTVETDKKPTLDNNSSRLVFYKRGMPIMPDKSAVLTRVQALHDALTAKLETETAYDFPIPLGRYRSPDQYYSFQRHFPEIYGLSDNGLPANASDQRQAQALQLKAYLLFFDQILANYLKQLASLRQLFSSDAAIKRSYFYQVVESFSDWDKVYAETDPLAAIEANIDDATVSVERRNRFLDHLIGRFAEQFTEFANIMHSAFGMSDTALIDYKCDFINHYPVISRDRGLAYNYRLKELSDIWNSQNISGLEKRLCKLLGIANSDRRNLSDVAYDIYAEIDSTPDDEFRFRVRDKVSGAILLSSSTKYVTQDDARVEMRRAILFGSLPSSYQIKETSSGRFYFNVVDDGGEVIARRIEYFDELSQAQAAIDQVVNYLRTNYSDEGMYLIENILLRPEQDGDPFLPVCVDVNCNDCADADPYSYRVHIVLPAYGTRFANMDFRRYAEQLIRAEVPAHILPKICWINKDDMAALEKTYQDWLKLKHGRTIAQRVKKIGDFIKNLYAVKNVYPYERLRDCDADESQPKFILNRTSLGSFSETVENVLPPEEPPVEDDDDTDET